MRPWWGPRGWAAAVGFFVVAGATWWMLAAGGSGVNVATVLATTLAAIALWMAILDKLPGTAPGQGVLAEAAQDLAGRVRAAEKAERIRLLTDIGEARPADLPLRRYPPLPEPRGSNTARYLVRWRDDGGQAEGTLDGIAGYYRDLGVGRLVVLGAPGSGKTVLLNHLLLALVEAVARRERAASPREPVPVRLSLPAFDPGRDARHVDAAVLAQRLEEWIAGHLAEVYGQRYARALALVRGGWVLPILDGLDEMDRDEADPRDTDPVRARAVMRALNHPTEDGSVRRVVLACREPRYRVLAHERPGPSRASVLQDATAVYILPLAPHQVRDYLAARFPHPHGPAPDGSARVEERWQPVLDRLALDPRGALALALGSPLNLYLAVIGYYQPDTEPRRLARHTTDSVERELLQRYIPAVTLQHPLRWGLYRPQDVRRWLGTLARHLDERQSAGRSGTDLYLYELWRAAGPLRPRCVAALAVALSVALPLLIVGWHQLNADADFDMYGYPILFDQPNITVLLAGTLLVLAAGLGSALWTPRMRRIDPGTARTRAGRRALVRGLAQGIVTGLLFGFAVRAVIQPILAAQLTGAGTNAGEVETVVGFAPGLAFGLTAGLVIGLSAVPRTAVRPRDLMIRGMAYTSAYSLAGGIAFGYVFWLVGTLTVPGTEHPGELVDGMQFWTDSTVSQLVGTAPGLTFGLAFGLALGLSTSPWPRYAVGARILTRRGQLPRHTTRFLDWACDAGLLKLSGVAIQFRHQRLHAHLAMTIPAPPPAPARARSHRRGA